MNLGKKLSCAPIHAGLLCFVAFSFLSKEGLKDREWYLHKGAYLRRLVRLLILT
jgi:hypothetical protein